MPTNYNASLRLAQCETAAERWDDAIAACDRGLAHVTGPIGRTWLLQVKAKALVGKGEIDAARRALEQALVSARTISNPSNRENNVRRVSQSLESLGHPAGAP